MSYTTIIQMNGSSSLRDRIVAAVAKQQIEGVTDPVLAVTTFMWKIIAREEWEARWADAVANYNDMYNPDIGARPDVITDDMIEQAVLDVAGLSG
jgi:hypothetical protein